MSSVVASTRAASTPMTVPYERAISASPYTARAPSYSWLGLIMWRVPCECTTSVAFGSDCISRPAPPA